MKLHRRPVLISGKLSTNEIFDLFQTWQLSILSWSIPNIPLIHSPGWLHAGWCSCVFCFLIFFIDSLFTFLLNIYNFYFWFSSMILTILPSNSIFTELLPIWILNKPPWNLKKNVDEGLTKVFTEDNLPLNLLTRHAFRSWVKVGLCAKILI